MKYDRSLKVLSEPFLLNEEVTSFFLEHITHIYYPVIIFYWSSILEAISSILIQKLGRDHDCLS